MKKLVSILLIVLITFASGCGAGATGEGLDELLSLGQKYLLEGNYEEAIIAFEKVIEIDEKCVDAYFGIVSSYVGLEQADKAISIIEVGSNAIDADQKEDFLSKSISKLSGLLSEEELNALLEMDFIKQILSDDDSRGIYIGEYDDEGRRSGNGTLLYGDGYRYIGQWENDMPNGEGTVIFPQGEPESKEEGYTYGIETVESGTFKDGLQNGAMNIVWHMDNGEVHNWNLTAENGHWVKIDGDAVAYCTTCDADLSGDGLNGVRGFTE